MTMAPMFRNFLVFNVNNGTTSINMSGKLQKDQFLSDNRTEKQNCIGKYSG